MKFLLSDFLVVIAGSVIITAFSFLYYKDITTKVEAGNSEVVGTLKYKRKTTERKYSGQVIWEDIGYDVPVYNNDAIRTADESEALVRLIDGAEIKLNENSMILLALNKNQIDIEFNQGSISASRGDTGGELKKLNIKSGKTSVLIAKSDVKLSQNNAGDLSLSVAKGSADIDTGKGTAKIGTDKSAVIAKNSGDVVTFELGIKLIYPSSDAYHLTASGKKRIDFSWHEVKGQHIVFLELSRNDIFDNIIQKIEIKGNAFSAELGKGIYYWRIRAVHKITKKQVFSESRRFTVLWDDPVLLISPADKEAVFYRTALPIINFKWTKSEIASGYKLLLAGDPSMNRIIKTFDAPRNNIAVDTLGKGVYYWRIEKVTGLKDIPQTSPSRIFELSINERKIIAPPELEYPTNAKQFSRILFEKQNITFTWGNSPDIREYRFFLSRDEKFEDIVFAGTSKVNFLQLQKNLSKNKGLEPLVLTGKYYWRVIGKLEADESTAPSQARTFSVIDTEEIKLISPQQNASLSPEENESSASARFSWKASEIKGRYKLRISKKEDFSSLYKEIIAQFQTTALSVQIEPGKYYWKVMLVDDDDSILADCAPLSFSVENNLATPVVISPRDGYIINMSDKDLLSLNWNRVAGANLYRVALYQIIKGKEYKIADIEENGTSYKITDLRKLDESSFYWTLQAFETSGNKKDIIRKSVIVKSNFKITLGKPIEKVNVKSLKIENL